MKKFKLVLLTAVATCSLLSVSLNASTISDITIQSTGYVESQASSIGARITREYGVKNIMLNDEVTHYTEHDNEKVSLTYAESGSKGNFTGGAHIHVAGKVAVGNSWQNKKTENYALSGEVGMYRNHTEGFEESILDGGNVSDYTIFETNEVGFFENSDASYFTETVTTKSYFAE